MFLDATLVRNRPTGRIVSNSILRLRVARDTITDMNQESRNERVLRELAGRSRICSRSWQHTLTKSTVKPQPGEIPPRREHIVAPGITPLQG